jgi:hypothetical protein
MDEHVNLFSVPMTQDEQLEIIGFESKLRKIERENNE